MYKGRTSFAVLFGVAVAAACGGASTGGNTADGGHSGSSSGSSAGSSGGPNTDGAPGMPSTTQMCTSPSDCPSGQTCMPSGGGVRSCLTPCMAGTCSSGQVCCTGNPTCQTGSCPTGSFQLCSSTADCPAPQTCMAYGVGGIGGMGGGPMICQGASCTGGSCGSGQVCCTAGNLFGAGPVTCHTGTSCPRGTYQVCSSSADCPSGELCATVARAADGGAGAMYCFPGVADAGAGGG
jgi:hypothetical protein